MQLRLIPQALALLLTLGFCLVCQAEKHLLTEFHIQLDDSIGHGDSPVLSESYQGKEKIQLENMPIESEYPTWIEDVTVDVDYKMSPLKPWNFSEAQALTSENFSAVVNIGTLRTEYSETQRSGGMIITMDFQAECKNIPLTLSKAGTVFNANITPINHGNRVELRLNSSNIQWPKDAWTQGKYTCTGVKGFEKILEQEFDKYLKNPDSLQNMIFKKLKERVALWEKQLNDDLFQKNYIQEDVSNYISFFLPQQLLKADARKEFKMAGHFHNVYSNLSLKEKNSETIKFRSQPPSINYDDGATFAIPVQSVPELIKDFAKNGNITEMFTSDEVDGFSDYMKSERDRRYTWPDLLRFDHNDKFKFEMTVLENPTLYSLQESSNGGLVGRIKGRMVIHMFAPVGGRYWPYSEWLVPFDSVVTFKLKEGVLTAQLGQGSYDWNAKFVSVYVNKFRPSDTSIDAKTIGEKLMENMRQKAFTWNLPLWKLTNKAKFKAAKLSTTADHLLVYWDLQK